MPFLNVVLLFNTLQDLQSYYPLMQVYGVEIPTRCFVGGLPYSVSSKCVSACVTSGLPCAFWQYYGIKRKHCTWFSVNFAPQMTELELNKFFSQFGMVKDSKIITDRKGVSKGWVRLQHSVPSDGNAGQCRQTDLKCMWLPNEVWGCDDDSTQCACADFV